MGVGNPDVFVARLRIKWEGRHEQCRYWQLNLKQQLKPNGN